MRARQQGQDLAVKHVFEGDQTLRASGPGEPVEIEQTARLAIIVERPDLADAPVGPVPFTLSLELR
jgi:hypothetical protein